MLTCVHFILGKGVKARAVLVMQGLRPALSAGAALTPAAAPAASTHSALQLYAGRSIDSLQKALKMLSELVPEDDEEEEVSAVLRRCSNAILTFGLAANAFLL